ncbi:MAG: cation transporter [Saprospiraceae bacterium]|nr:cation transporter [Saprospiraceae bacterium]
MEKLKFKTNINCMGCVAKFTPHIENAEGVQTWEVDTATPDKVLTIVGNLTESEAIALVTKAGFQVRAVVQQ